MTTKIYPYEIVDALTQALNDNLDIVYLGTGDGDYLPLVEQLISSRLNQGLRQAADMFIDLDEIFFEYPATVAKRTSTP